MPGIKASEDVRRGQILEAAFEVASREGLGGLTVRRVAAEAGLSHGLVHFHFKRKERLVADLLDWLIPTVPALRVAEAVAALPSAAERLDALLEQEVERLVRHPAHVRLFFEYWALGVRDESIRRRIGGALDRYRTGLGRVVEEALRARPDERVAPDALAAVVLSCIHGCAAQALADPGGFDARAYLATVREVLRRPG